MLFSKLILGLSSARLKSILLLTHLADSELDSGLNYALPKTNSTNLNLNPCPIRLIRVIDLYMKD